MLFCLVHGAWHDEACWQPLVAGCPARVVPVLPLDDDGSFDDYAEVVVDCLRDRATPVLVGHSMSSAVIPLVALKRPVRLLVYLCPAMGGFPPSPGEPPQRQAGYESPPVDTSGRSRWPRERAITQLYRRVGPELADRLAGRLRPQPRAVFDQPYPLACPPDIPSAFIFSREDELFDDRWSRWIAHTLLGLEPIELPGGHFPMLERPAALADVLETASGDQRSRLPNLGIRGAARPARPRVLLRCRSATDTAASRSAGAAPGVVGPSLYACLPPICSGRARGACRRLWNRYQASEPNRRSARRRFCRVCAGGGGELRDRRGQRQAAQGLVRVRAHGRSAVQVSGAHRACGANRKLARARKGVPGNRAASSQRGGATSDRRDRVSAGVPDLAQGAGDRQCRPAAADRPEQCRWRANRRIPAQRRIDRLLPRQQQGGPARARAAEKCPPSSRPGRAQGHRDDLLVAPTHRTAPPGRTRLPTRLLTSLVLPPRDTRDLPSSATSISPPTTSVPLRADLAYVVRRRWPRSRSRSAARTPPMSTAHSGTRKRLVFASRCRVGLWLHPGGASSG